MSSSPATSSLESPVPFSSRLASPTTTATTTMTVPSSLAPSSSYDSRRRRRHDGPGFLLSGEILAATAAVESDPSQRPRHGPEPGTRRKPLEVGLGGTRGHRPRLSAEYVAPSRRRRSSFASVGARSAPATAARANDSDSDSDSDSESESAFSRDSDEQVDDVRQRRGRRTRRLVARSEGAGARDDDDGGGDDKKDVRKGYEALRERLRAAASSHRAR
ncbi:hypothetical protein JCM11491_006149 [Sporobolomyces phaffii]